MESGIRVKQAKFLANKMQKTIGAQVADGEARRKEMSKDINLEKHLGFDLTGGEAGRFRRSKARKLNL